MLEITGLELFDLILPLKAKLRWSWSLPCKCIFLPGGAEVKQHMRGEGILGVWAAGEIGIPRYHDVTDAALPHFLFSPKSGGRKLGRKKTSLQQGSA